MLKYTLLVLLFLTVPARADHFSIAIASDDDLYVGDLLKLALEKAGGNHTLEIIRGEPITQTRALRALEDGRADYNVIYSAYTANRARKLILVEFPLTRGLLGYRVLAIRGDKPGRLATDAPYGQLRSNICFGSGRDWPDTTIMRKAGLCVVTATDESLWRMLIRGRFDALPRGLIEVASELERERDRDPDVDLTLDPHVMLTYRQDLFFYLSRKNAARAAIIQTGLQAAHADGSYDRYFYNLPAIRTALEILQQSDRVTFYLRAPTESASLQKIPDAYWYDFQDSSTYADFLTAPIESGQN
jgi:hypothetical protein